MFHSSVFGAKTRAGSCISQRAVAFQSGPDEKTDPLRKAPQLIRSIVSFSLIKKKFRGFDGVFVRASAFHLSLWVRFLLRTDVKRVCLHSAESGGVSPGAPVSSQGQVWRVG